MSYNEPKVYCIIVTYNGMKWIDRCLASLRMSKQPLQVIVIDNLSTDETVDYVRSNFPKVLLIEAGANLGFGKANNIGLRKALDDNADYVFLLNQDAWVNESTISELLNIFNAFPGYGILSPIHTNVTGRTLDRQFIDFVSSAHNEQIISDIFFNRLQPVYETTYIHAACWLMSAQCVQTVGGFDPLYYHYGEDDDYMQRVKHFGFKIGLVPTAFIVHDGVYKSWKMMEFNKNRNLVIEFQQLKKMSPHFRTNVLVYLKSRFDEITTLLVFRKFKKLGFRLKVIGKVLTKMKTVQSSYKASFKKGAFLQ